MSTHRAAVWPWSASSPTTRRDYRRHSGADTAFDGIVINPGAYTHYSYAIHDALKAVSIPAVEVHMSDIQKREEFRHLSVTAPACIAQIRGHGFESYTMAIDMLAKLNPEEK